jgi:hypothetical protein
MRLILRQTSQSELSAEQAEAIVRGYEDARLLSCEGKTMLVDVDPGRVEALRERLSGWLVTEEGAPRPVPDACLHIKR